MESLEDRMANALRDVEHLEDKGARGRAYLAAGIDLHTLDTEHAAAADELAHSMALLARMRN